MSDSRKRILVVDDESSVRDSLKLLLKTNFQVEVAEDGEQALSMLETFEPDLVLLDVIMPKLDGLETLKRVKEGHPTLPVVMLTATNTVRTAVQAMKYGATDYLNKPFDVEELTSLIVDTLEEAATHCDTEEQRASKSAAIPEIRADYGPMVGKSTVMEDLFQRIGQVAERGSTVLVTGESGTGKELVARLIHDKSARANQPFVPINCAAIPETLIESELFGHERGAFTHAVEKRIGHFELADQGTLFLDEIGELSMAVQVKLLRFLQEQELYRVGSSKPIKVNVRIIAATNRNLEEAIKQQTFRQDLFYRINVINLEIPPLRDRFEDIEPLLSHFVTRFQPLYGDRALSFSEEALRTLIEYPWPGNVRELENVVESLMALAQQSEVQASDLPARLKVKRSFKSLKEEALDGSLNFEEAERQFETEIISKALQKTNYVQTRAAALLGISRRILKYKMDKLGIGDKPKEAQSEEEVSVKTEDVPLPKDEETLQAEAEG